LPQEVAGKEYLKDEEARKAAREAAKRRDDPDRQIEQAVKAKQAARNEARLLAESSQPKNVVFSASAKKTAPLKKVGAAPEVQALASKYPVEKVLKVESEVEQALEASDSKTDAVEAKLLMQTYAGKGPISAAGLEAEVKRADEHKLKLIQDELKRIGSEMAGSKLVAGPATSAGRLQDPLTGPVDSVQHMKSSDKDPQAPLEPGYDEVEHKAAPTGDEGEHDDDPFQGASKVEDVKPAPEDAGAAEKAEKKTAELSSAAAERAYLRKYVAKMAPPAHDDAQLERDAARDEKRDEETVDSLTGKLNADEDKSVGSAGSLKSDDDDEDDDEHDDSNDEGEGSSKHQALDDESSDGDDADSHAHAARKDAGEKLVSLSKDIRSKADLQRIRAELDKDYAKVTGEGKSLVKFAQKEGLAADISRRQNAELEQVHP
jgi:hypothetical protein